MSGTLLRTLLPYLWGFLVLYCCLSFGGTERKSVSTRAFEDREQPPGPLTRQFIALVRLVAKLIEDSPGKAERARVAPRLVQAGLLLTPDEFFAGRLIALIFFPLVGAVFDWTLDFSPAFLILMFGLGAVYPSLWLKGMIQRRQRRVFRDLPDMLDILRLATAAGLDFSSALRVVVENVAHGPLLDEFEKVERDMVLGKTRSAALQSMAARLGMNEMNAFVMAVKQADDLGASVGPILAIQSQMARDRRWQMAEVLVGKLPMKLLGPLVVCIFPASFIVLFTPLILDYLESGF